MHRISTAPDVLSAMTKQKYEKPTFEVIDIEIQLPLLSGSGTTPSGKKIPSVKPLDNGGNW